MTTTEKARQIVLFVRDMPEAEAIEYVRALLLEVAIAGERSGVEQARQALNAMEADQALAAG